MIGIAYLIWICVSVFFCYRLAVGGKKRSRTKALFCMTLAAVLILLPYWDVLLGIPTLRKICSEEAGVRKYEDVQFPLSSAMVVSSDGARSLCLTCYFALIKGLTQEAHAEITLSGGQSGSALIDQSGIARYWLAASGDPACAAFEKTYSMDHRRDLWRDARVTYDEKTCIASERVARSTADFTLTYPITSVIQRGVAVIRSRRVELRRSDQSDAIATLTHFMQLPWNGRIFSMQAGLPPAPSCPSFVHPITPRNFVPEYLLELLSGQRQEGEIFK